MPPSEGSLPRACVTTRTFFWFCERWHDTFFVLAGEQVLACQGARELAFVFQTEDQRLGGHVGVDEDDGFHSEAQLVVR